MTSRTQETRFWTIPASQTATVIDIQITAAMRLQGQAVRHIRRLRGRGLKFLSDTNPLGMARCPRSGVDFGEARRPSIARAASLSDDVVPRVATSPVGLGG